MILEWVLSSSMLILVVLTLRGVLGKKISARLRYALWAVVLLRLLAPVQLFTFPAVTLQTNLNFRQVSIDVLPVNRATMEQAGQAGASIETDEPYSGSADDPRPEDDRTSIAAYLREITPVRLLEGLWAVGSVLTFATLAGCNLRFAARLRRSREKWDGETTRLPVYVSEGLPSPCLFGAVRPAIYVPPTVAENPAAMRHVLTHEMTHFCHKDHIWSTLRVLALAIHWWNPLVWLAVRLSKRDGELACDEGTLRRLGDGERAAYGATLLSLVTIRPQLVDFFSCATTMSGSKRSLRERIRRIAHTPRQFLWAAVVVILLTSLAAGCAFAKASEQAVEAQAVSWTLVEDNGETREELNLRLSEDCATNFILMKGDTVTVSVAEDERVIGEGLAGWTRVSYDRGETWESLDISWLDYALAQLKAEDFDTLSEDGTASDLAELLNGLAGHRNSRFWPVDANEALTDSSDHRARWDVSVADGSTLHLFATKSGVLYIVYEMSGVAPSAFYDEAGGALYDLICERGTSLAADLPEIDLNRNGIPEELSVVAEDMIYTLQAVELAGSPEARTIWAAESADAHAGWNALFQVQAGGGDCILEYHPMMYQGMCDYSYRVFYLDENGGEIVVDEDTVSFDINFQSEETHSFDARAIAAFMEEANRWLADSTELLVTDSGLLSSYEKWGGPQDKLWWLDDDTYTRDEHLSLLENLLRYQDAKEAEASPVLSVLSVAYAPLTTSEGDLSEEQKAFLEGLSTEEMPKTAVDVYNIRQKDIWMDTLVPVASNAEVDVTLYAVTDPEMLAEETADVLFCDILNTSVMLFRCGDRTVACPLPMDFLHGGNPRLFVDDFNGDGAPEAAVCLYNAHGTGISIYYLYLFDLSTLHYTTPDLSTLPVNVQFDLEAGTAVLTSGDQTAVCTVEQRLMDLQSVSIGNVVSFSYTNGQLSCTMALDFSGRTTDYLAEVEAPVVWTGTQYQLGAATRITAYEP